MVNKELKRLSRRELVDIIYQLKKNEQELQEQICSLKSELDDKRIRISKAGSIAEAAMSMTDVFSTAQMTAELYLREISNMKDDTERECAKRIEAAEKRVEEVMNDGKKKIANLKSQYKNEYMKWKQLQSKIEAFEQMKKQGLCEDIEND